MKADFSRNTFHPWRHYRRVLGQQGRVVIDADANEQTSINLATTEQTTFDVIGPAGVPETSLSSGYDGGFQIGIASGGGDLTISHGRIYVDGLLVENNLDTTLTTQPFLPLSPGNFGPAGVSGKGSVYGVYLDAWERVITAVDDPEILEIALGGPDTSLRSQIAWQVKLGAIDTSEFGENPSCAEILPPWGEIANQGKLAAQGGAPSTDPLPCVLPPQTGYQSLENQLYRVEIHTAGGYGTATFKWSRENGSVIAGIVSQLNGSFSSPTFKVTTVGRDSTLGFAPGDWVELIDDDSEFQTGHGELIQCGTVDGNAMTISLQTAPTLTIDPTKHPKLRRWDQQQGANANGVLISDGSWIALENGVQVQFSNGQFEIGDYWLIPARTATSADTTGTIEWRIDSTTNAPAFEYPKGIKHYYAKLAIVAFNGETFTPPPGASGVTDCRIFFPPLTDLQPQASPCTLVLEAGSDWVGLINSLFANQPSLDAEICFATGTFATTQPVVIATTGNVKVSGAGLGTRLIGTGIEAVLQFQGCATAIVRDLYASADSVDAPPDGTTKASRVIHGALDFVSCGEVLVENVSLSCGAALLPGAACLVVRSDPTLNPTTGTGVARVRGSTFAVGEMQYGVLLVHQQRAYVEDNAIGALQTSGLKWSAKIGNALFQRQIVKQLVGSPSLLMAKAASSSSSSSTSTSTTRTRASLKSRAVATPKSAVATPKSAAATPKSAVTTPEVEKFNAGVAVGGNAIKFVSPPQIGQVFQTYVDLNGPKEFANQNDLYTYVSNAAHLLVTDPAARSQFPSLGQYINGLERNDPVVGARAIAVGGRAITELRITDNSIANMLAGIIVGVSHRERRPPALPADSMQHIRISGNVINLVQPAVTVGSMPRFGIFAGNLGNLMIEGNEVSVASLRRLPTDGIRVYGYLGKKMIVRHNHTAGFTRDIFVRALLPTGPKPGTTYWFTTPPAIGTPNTNLWLVADNLVEGNNIDAQACMVVDNWP